MENIILYSFFNGDRSNRVRWCLHEIGLEFTEYQDWQPGERFEPAFLQISPFGKMPGLKIDNEVYFDSGAICQNLADRYPHSGLAPDLFSPLRKNYLEWCATAISTIESILGPLNSGHKFHHQTENKAADFAISQFERIGPRLETLLLGKNFILERDFSVADILLTTALMNGLEKGILSPFPEVRRYISCMRNRPAAKKADV